MNFVPLYDRLLVRRCEAAKYQGMIEIPDSAKEKPMEGEVLAVGAGRYNDAGNLMPMSVQVGARILMGKYAGTEIKIDGTDLLILREDEVLGLVVGPALAEVKPTIEAITEMPEALADLRALEPDGELFPPESEKKESAEDFLSALKDIGGVKKP
jgi:chaperonin GroES